jgi:hypothetical protein
MTSLYQDILTHRCTSEKKIIENALSLALYYLKNLHTVTKTPGHMELVAGETIHIVKYIPV